MPRPSAAQYPCGITLPCLLFPSLIFFCPCGEHSFSIKYQWNRYSFCNVVKRDRRMLVLLMFLTSKRSIALWHTHCRKYTEYLHTSLKKKFNNVYGTYIMFWCIPFWMFSQYLLKLWHQYLSLLQNSNTYPYILLYNTLCFLVTCNRFFHFFGVLH